MKSSDLGATVIAPSRCRFRVWSLNRERLESEQRARRPELFRSGGYQPPEAGRNVCAFARGEEVIVAVPRLLTSLVKPGVFPTGDVWGGAALNGNGRWKNIFTGDTLEASSLPLAEFFTRFPVAVLELE